MNYVQANIRKRKREVLYETYVTDTLKNTNDILASSFTGSVMKRRYIDMIKMINEPIKEARSADEIIEDIGNRLDMIGET